jgi:hypothetical protein
MHETAVKFCQDILLELFGMEWVLVTGVSGCVASVEDLCVWNFASAEAAIPQGSGPPKPCKQWFALHRMDLRAPQEIGGTADLRGLLKPVARGSLGTFLPGTRPKRNEQNHDDAGRAGALRVQRNDMLHLVVRSNLKLQENDQKRSNLPARSVHDFRAPLTAISGYCGLLLDEGFGPLTPEQQSLLRRMLHGTTRFSRVSNAMFQLSALRNVDQGLNLEKTGTRGCLDQALQEVASVLEDKRISITAGFEPAPDSLLFEKSQVTQILVSLLDNSCRFTPPDGTIENRGYSVCWEHGAGMGSRLARPFLVLPLQQMATRLFEGESSLEPHAKPKPWSSKCLPIRIALLFFGMKRISNSESILRRRSGARGIPSRFHRAQVGSLRIFKATRYRFRPSCWISLCRAGTESTL